MNSYNNSININIETITGRSFPLKVSTNDTIQQIKIKIQRSEGIPVTHQQLIWQQNELDDKFTLRDYNINDGATIKMVLLLRGGPINSRRMTTEDLLLRDVSDLIEYREDFWDTYAMKNKHVTLLVIRDGDNFNLLRVIDRGDGSPLSGDVSAASMYAPYEEIDKEALDEEKQAENEITKEKMQLIRAQFNKKNITTTNYQPKPPSATKKTNKSSIKLENMRTKQYATSANDDDTNNNNSIKKSSTRKLTLTRKDLEKFDLFQNIDIDASILTMNYADLLNADLNPNGTYVDDEVYYEDNEEEDEHDEDDEEEEEDDEVVDEGDVVEQGLNDDIISKDQNELLHKSVLITKIDDDLNDNITCNDCNYHHHNHNHGLGKIISNLHETLMANANLTGELTINKQQHQQNDMKQKEDKENEQEEKDESKELATSAKSILSRNHTSSKMLQSTISINNDEVVSPILQSQISQEPNLTNDDMNTFNKRQSILMRTLSNDDKQQSQSSSIFSPSQQPKLSLQQKYFFNTNLIKRNTQINPLPNQPTLPTVQNYQETTFSLLPNPQHSTSKFSSLFGNNDTTTTNTTSTTVKQSTSLPISHTLNPLMYPRGSISGTSGLTSNNNTNTNRLELVVKSNI